MTEQEKQEAIVENAAAKLFEHFDSVQILVSKTGLEGTTSVKRGLGNWYARQGMAHEFISDDKARSQAEEIRMALNNED
jgi:hypothetical protein